jgi:hypothetical protein
MQKILIADEVRLDGADCRTLTASATVYSDLYTLPSGPDIQSVRSIPATDFGISGESSEISRNMEGIGKAQATYGDVEQDVKKCNMM